MTAPGSLRNLSILGFIVMVVAIMGLALGHALLTRLPIAVAFQVAALALMVWARVTFGRRSFHAAANATEGGLVTDGPYRWIRHPIYTGICLFAWAGIVPHLSVVSVLLGAIMIAGAIVRMLAEERLLVQRYPDYAQYAQRTKRMVPYVF